MQSHQKKEHINASRFLMDFEELSQIGATQDGGVSRPALSNNHLLTRAWFKDKIAASGLEFRVDGAGNHSGFLKCGPDNAPTMLMGSHLDSVPHGGRYDGALGVLAALEVLRTIKETGKRLPVNLEVIDFTDEEGTLMSFLGSKAFTGILEPERFEKPRGGKSALQEGMQQAGLSRQGILSAVRDPQTLHSYIELHVEQSPYLEDAGADIGIVTAITGIQFFRLFFFGHASHAGTTPMNNRQDAALGAAAYTLETRQILQKSFPDCLMNIGQINLEPGNYNIIPEKATLRVECRSPEADQLIQLKTALIQCARQVSDRFHLGMEIEEFPGRLPTPMNPMMQEAVRNSAVAQDLKHMTLHSGAGHDAQALARIIPTGVIFIPSRGGISHSPDEYTSPEACVNGANVLLQTALQIAGTPKSEL